MNTFCYHISFICVKINVHVELQLSRLSRTDFTLSRTDFTLFRVKAGGGWGGGYNIFTKIILYS